MQLGIAKCTILCLRLCDIDLMANSVGTVS